MKINKTILKNIIKEILNSGDFDSIVGEMEQKTTASTDKLTKQFTDKIIRVAPTELAQIDDVDEVVATLKKLLDVIQQSNPIDFTESEFKRVGIFVKQLGMDMQTRKTNPNKNNKPLGNRGNK
tara:strand:- start:110 stop:478 length:369 start_codon:yes stop_codon:yes gene_type:complete